MLKKELKTQNIKRGEVCWVRLDQAEGSRNKKTRPTLIISNDEQNSKSKVIIVAPISKKVNKIYPTFQVPVHLKGGVEKN